MPDEDGFFCARLLQEILQGVCEGGDADVWKRRRAAIARHVPCDGAIPITKGFQLAAPRPRRAANSMQEHKRRQNRTASGFIAKTEVTGFHRRGMRHAGTPCLVGPTDAHSTSAYENRYFIFKAIFAPQATDGWAASTL